MAQPFPNVLPGDLITADQMNQILQALSSLDVRVSNLEGSSVSANAVIISGLIPPSGSLKIGDQLTVLGSNFAFSTGALRVYIDDTRVDSFLQGTSDTQIVFNIPLTLSAPQSGRSATLTVSNATSTAQRTLLLQSALVLTGTLDVINQGVTPATITAGQAATFAYRLHSRFNMDATVAVSASVSIPAWQSNVQLLDANQNPLSSGQVLLRAGQDANIFVRISPIPPGTNGTQFSVTVNVTAANVTQSSGANVQTVGSQATQPDTTISLSYLSSQTQPPNSGNISASQIQIPSGTSAQISFNATFSVAGQYTITATLSGGATNWTVGPKASTTPSPYTISQNDLQNPQGIATKTLDFVLQRQNGATSGQVQFTIQRQGAAQSYQLQMPLIAL
jgi:hypothetical protein